MTTCFRMLLTVSVSAITIAVGGCTLLSREMTYAVSTETGDMNVICEWFGHDGGYWEPTTEDTYEFQWVCDAIPDYGIEAPQTVINPGNGREVARLR